MSDPSRDPSTADSKLFDVQYELLKTELDLVNSAIRQQDDITKGIKNWSIVTWSASIGLCASTPNLQQYTWMTAIVPTLFWFVDASFRRIQRTFITRVVDISTYVNSQSFQRSVRSRTALDFPLLTMRRRRKDWLTDWSGWRKNSLIGVMFFRSVSLLYMGLVLGSLLLWYFAFN